MDSFALSATTCGARKHAWTNLLVRKGGSMQEILSGGKEDGFSISLCNCLTFGPENVGLKFNLPHSTLFAKPAKQRPTM